MLPWGTQGNGCGLPSLSPAGTQRCHQQVTQCGDDPAMPDFMQAAALLACAQRSAFPYEGA